MVWITSAVGMWHGDIMLIKWPKYNVGVTVCDINDMMNYEVEMWRGDVRMRC